MASPFLFSTNPLLKFEIHRDYFGNKHYVWCSPCFDARTSYLHGVTPLPPSSNPAEIFAALRAATMDRPDFHDKNIKGWKGTLQGLALSSRSAGSITAEQEEDIVYLTENADITKWRPLLYVINRAAVAGRLQTVPVPERANPSVAEYQLADLLPEEFDIITL